MTVTSGHTPDAQASWPLVDLREIRVCLTLAHELHFGRTAERLQLTTSHVSNTIRKLEARVGGRLFDRTSRRVRLTPLGERLLANVAPVYAEFERALDDAREAATGVTGALRIGFYTPLSAGPHMTAIVDTFTTRHPGCEVVFIDTGMTRDYLAVLRAGEVDMLATRLPLNAPDVTIGPVLSREERVVVVATNDPLAARDSISYEDLAGRAISDIAAFPREMMDALHPGVTPGGRPLRRIPVGSAQEVMMQVALGELVHPTVRSFLDHHSHPGVTSVPIRDQPPSETALVWLAANRSPTIDAFVRAAGDVLEQRAGARRQGEREPAGRRHHSSRAS